MNKKVSLKIQNYVEKRESIHTAIINYIDGEENLEKDIFKFFNEQKVQEPSIFDFKEILDFLVIIIENHSRGPDFFTKIIEIITYFKDDIKQNLTNKEFFDMFTFNNTILYLLFEQKMIVPDKSIIEILKKPDKIDYFEPIIEMYYTNQPFDDYDEAMREKRKSGVNDSIISQFIRNDSVEEFIRHITINNYPLDSKIKKSYFETNKLLMKREPTFIEYAAFYGAIQIFNYLRFNGVELTSSLWIYTIHSRNAELIHILEENDVKPDGENFEECVIEAIKCHHNPIANYLIDKENQKRMKYLLYYLNYDNYELISINRDCYIKCNIQIEHLASIITNYPEFANLLFDEKYLDINYRKNKNRLFAYAFEKRDIYLIKFLLSKPNINPNIIIRDGKTALIISIEKDDNELVKLLLECPEIDINACCQIHEIKTALTTAFEKKK